MTCGASLSHDAKRVTLDILAVVKRHACNVTRVYRAGLEKRDRGWRDLEKDQHALQ